MPTLRPNRITAGLALVAIAAILAFTTVMTVSAQSDDRDWKQPVTGLTAVAGDDPGEMIISWDAHTQTTKTLLNYRVAWTPQGDSFKSADQTDWNVYTTSNQHTVTGLNAGATYQVKVRTRYEGNQGSRWTDVVTVSVQSDTPEWKLPVTGLTVTTGEDSGELLIAWNHHPQTTKTFLNYRVAWAPQGESFKSADQTDWNVHTTNDQHTVIGLDAGATYQVKVRTRYEGRQGSRWTDVVTGQSAVTTNTPATGQPTIAGTAEVGETLTAATSSISDANGLANTAFAYQWIHTATDSEAYIPAATGSSYLLSSDDLGHSIKVRVTFTDDDGYTEKLTSSATALVIMQANVAATGQPTITGNAEVGETLTAATSAISDSNGITNAVFSHQWVRSTAGSHSDISGATSSAYVITPDDAESKIKVSVSFTDDNGYSETLTSASTASVPANRQNQPRDATDATLSDLELEGNGGETITLSPEFASGTTAYTAAVANRIDTVKVTATKNQTNAAVVITSDDDTSTPGVAELDLSVGANALTVTVTAEDASILTYTITATRATAPPAPTDCPTDTDWCATLVLGYIPISSAQFTTEQFGYFSDSNFGDLRSATFSHGGISYTVSTIVRVKVTRDSDSVVQTDNITFTVSPELPDGTVLQLDTRTFTVDADSEGTSTGQEQWDIKADPPVWTDGQHVTVSLKLPSTDDAKLSALSVVSAPGGHTVYLTPAFDADTNTYTASVANRINAVKLTATKKSTSVTVAITNDSDTNTPDEAEFDLTLGANTLTVTSTAENATTQTYTVTVTRAAAPPTPTDCPADTDWCTTLTVGYDTQTTPDAEIEWLGYQSYATYGDLLSTTFSHVGTAYTVSLLYDFKNTPVGTNTADANSLNLTTNPPLPDGAVLQVGNRIFTVDTDSATTSAGLEQWDILHDPLNWTQGQHVTTSLRFSGAYDDATLSSLVIEGANNSESITVSPAFDDDTFIYTATVPNGIDAVTVTAATNNSNATVVINADDDTNTKNEANLVLSVGTNTLTVTVTAEDTVTTETYTITVTRERDPAEPVTVPIDWSLIPSGLTSRDQFRLLFLSSIRRNSSSSAITDYNTFVQGRAAAGHTDIQAYSDRFMAVGCTEAVDALDNTGTTFTNSNKGVPIYWLAGTKVANEYEDFYDGSWDDEANGKNELGTTAPDTSNSSNYPLTGCSDDGTEKISGSVSSALGNGGGDVTIARPNSSGAGHGPLSSGQKITETFTRPMYGLSTVFTVADSSDATLSNIAIEGTADGQTVVLSPGFDDDTLTYTARVGNGIDEVTLTSTTNDSNATVVITNDDNASTPGTADLGLSVGSNTLVITVTAMDTTTTLTYTITVTRADSDSEILVPSDWSLVPSGLSAGDSFRLLFLSSTRRDASSTSIDTYNDFVQGRAANGHTDIQAYSDGFTVVGCTTAVDALDNTATTFTTSEKGIPIYWLNGNKVADEYEDFYDGDWDDEANDKNQSGNNGPDTSDNEYYPLTGCDHDGTEKLNSA